MPRFFPRALVDQLYLETAALGPAHVHAQKHRRPILALGAARSRVHFEIGIHAVGFAGEQSFHAALLDFVVQFFEQGLGFRDGRGVTFGLTHLDEGDVVFEFLLHTLESSTATSPAIGAGASPSELRQAWPKWPDLQRGDLVRPDALRLGPGQRYLLRSASASWMLSTVFCASARMRMFSRKQFPKRKRIRSSRI